MEVRNQTMAKDRFSFFINIFRVGARYLPTDVFHVRVNKFERECYNRIFPLGVIGGVSDDEKKILGEILHKDQTDISWELTKGISNLQGNYSFIKIKLSI